MRGHGLSVIEVLIALALFVLAAALAGPALFARIDPMTMDSAASELESVLRRVREEARGTGEARLVSVSTVAAGGPAEIVAARHPPGNGVTPGNGAGTLDPGSRREVLMKIPARIRVLDQSDAEDEAEFGPGADVDLGFEPPDPGGNGGLGQGGASERLFLVCLPDGSVIAPSSLRLSSLDGRVAMLTTDPALGLIRVVLTRAPREGGAGGISGEDGLIEFPEVGG